jgi:glycosyltransferase involved in cell wall biosynthesis
MVLQEAAAMSIPTITTNIPGASEAIVDGVTGLLAEVKNADSLKSVMEKLKNDPSLCKKFGENGRKRIEEDFERSKMVERLIADYKEIYEETRKQK